jgi:hypothetical protein
MTDIRKSDAQLDAEAAEERDLDAAIALHRELYRSDRLILRLHDRDGESGIGPPFSAPFEHLLDERYGVVMPWSNGWRGLRYECRRSHSEHWATEWGGSLCARLIALIVIDERSYGRACYDLHVDQERTERTLLRAFRRIEERMDELQARATETVKSDEGRHDWQAPKFEHHAVDGLHQQDCLQCIRRRTAA